MPRRLAAVSIAAAALVWAACPGPDTDREKPRSVILLIGDGMGVSQISLARQAALPPGERFVFESMPVTGLVSTGSASNPVTDSGAAATALAAGVKTGNQRVGTDLAGEPLETLTDVAIERGWRVGYVTTTEITHATPAAFYAKVQNRYTDVERIAADLLDQAPDVVLGGGQAQFLPLAKQGRRTDGRDLLGEARGAGYTVWDSSSDLDAELPDRLLGLFAGGHFHFSLDNARLPESSRTPPLSRLAETALSILGRDETPFFLLLEGGRVDHAGHSFDAAGVVAEMEDFDRAISVVLDYQKRNPDTLVLMTADHATGGLAINDFVDWDAIDRQTASNDWLIASIRDEDEPAGLEVIEEHTGYADFTAEDLDILRNQGDKYEGQRNLGWRLAQRHGVTWIPRVEPDTWGHTGEDVPIFSIGPGSQRFAGMLDNTDIPRILTQLLGWPPLAAQTEHPAE